MKVRMFTSRDTLAGRVEDDDDMFGWMVFCLHMYLFSVYVTAL
jgi:hypothetical protein